MSISILCLFGIVVMHGVKQVGRKYEHLVLHSSIIISISDQTLQNLKYIYKYHTPTVQANNRVKDLQVFSPRRFQDLCSLRD